MTTETDRRRALTDVGVPQSALTRRRAAYAVALFLSSAGGLILEIVAGRMIAPYVGMSLYTWTAVIAVVLAGFSIGHWIGGRLATLDHAGSCWRLSWLLGLAALATAACLPLIRVLSPLVLGAGFHPVAAIVLLTGSLFLLPSLFVGAVSPILTKLAVDTLPHESGRAIGLMFASGAVGSIAGTLAAGYVLISWIGSIGSVLAVAAGYLLLAAGFAWAAPASVRSTTVAVIALAASALSLLGLAHRVQAFASPCTEESQYYCIRILDSGGETGRPSAVMVLDHLGHGINDQAEPTFLHSPYLVLIDRMLRASLGGRERFAAFFIGGGANTLPRAWQAAYPGASLLIAEIDSAVTRTAQAHMWFEPGPSTRIAHGDARVLLRRLPRQARFDVIVGDAFRDISVPQHLTTVEFARTLRSRLTPSGFYALNVIDSARRPLFLLAVARTLSGVFPVVEVRMDPDQVRGGGRITYVVTAGAQGFAQEALNTQWIKWPHDDLIRAIRRSRVPILTDNYAPVDRLMLHVLAEDP